MKKKALTILSAAALMLSFSINIAAQGKPKDDVRLYPGGEAYAVKSYPTIFSDKAPKNVILLIGDGMGVAQLYAGLTANGGKLFIENCKHVGFSKTYSSDRYVTDSAAGQQLSTGTKTYNGAIGVGPDKTRSRQFSRRRRNRERLRTGLYLFHNPCYTGSLSHINLAEVRRRILQ